MKQFLAWLIFLVSSTAFAQEDSTLGLRLQALKPVAVATQSNWNIHQRDGANREVPPYLSSLAQGEAGTGVISSPTFTITSKTITFTIRGHDGQGGGRQKNFIALVDNKKGITLLRTMAPGTDALQEQRWDVAKYQGSEVRIEVHDELAEPAFAWLGIGQIDAGSALHVDFSKGMPTTWHATAKQVDHQTVLIAGDGVVSGIPFRPLQSAYSMIAAEGATEIPCGFTAKRLFLLGCTISSGQPLEIGGWVEIIYDQGPADRIPLTIGYTLDRQCKLLSQSPAIHLHPSDDPYQYYLVIQPKQTQITTIRLALNTGAVPRITAITCETDATSDTLLPLPTPIIQAAEKSWIDEHAIAADRINFVEIEAEIRRSHKIPAVTFQRSKLSDRAFEGASVCDLNNDGVPDLVSGGFWYQGPEFTRSHKIRDVKLVSEYLDDFADYPMDVNGDGYTDLVTGAYFGNPLQWLENPQVKTGLWPVHDISQVGPIETVRCWDIDGDGHMEVVPNAGGNVIFFRLATDGNGRGTGKFTKHVVKMGGCGHGLGFGDINGDGRGDFVVPGGWIESPADPLTGEWIWHHDGLQLGAASVPIGVHDVNEDGKADLIVGQAHGYGLDWFEQTITKSGQRAWVRHPIDRFSSQYHDMQLVDIDNDKQLELVTGKRYRAHNGHDPGSADPVFIRYYDIDKGRFTGHTIDYGHPQHASGVGIYFWVEDVNQDGWKDILAPGKEGLYLFQNRSFQDLN